MFKAGIVTVSDRSYQGVRRDESGPAIAEMLGKDRYEIVGMEVVPDEKEEIKRVLISLCDEKGCDVVFTTGGTGFSIRDVTPEATLEVGFRQAPGIAEAIRAQSLIHTKKAILSRAVSVIRGQSLIINLPGSPKAVRECLDFVLEPLEHGLDILSGRGTE